MKFDETKQLLICMNIFYEYIFIFFLFILFYFLLFLFYFL